MRLGRVQFFRSPPDGGGGGSGGGSGDGGGGPGGGPSHVPAYQGQQQNNANSGNLGQQQNQQQGQQQQQNQAGTAYRPDGLPDHLFGKSEKETIDNLWKSTKGFMDANAKRGAVPKDADGYGALTLAEPIGKKLGDLSKDPAYAAVRTAAHAAGITDKEFSAFMPKVLDAFEKAGFIPDGSQFDPAKVITALEADHSSIADPRERHLTASKRITDFNAQLDNLKTAKSLSEGTIEGLRAMTLAADEFRDAEKIIGLLTKAPGIAVADGGGQSAGVSEADITARRMDPRFDTRSPKYDKAFRDETDRLWREAENRKRNRAA